MGVRWVYWRSVDVLRSLALRVHDIGDPYVGQGPTYRRWLAGFVESAWVFYCGYGLKFALQIGWIHWRPR